MPEAIFKEEEKQLLSSVDKAKASSNNGQIIGRNGELPLLEFLNNYLPPNLKAVSGHFLTPESTKSPQIDVLIIDARYPLLGYNDDGSVLTMAHSVLKVIEIKTNLKTGELKKTASSFFKTRTLLEKIWEGENNVKSRPLFELFAYRIGVKESTIFDSYYVICKPIDKKFDVTILRSNQKINSGATISSRRIPDFIFERSIDPNYKIEDFKEIDKYSCDLIYKRTPLADFYYSLIMDSYKILSSRNLSLSEISDHFPLYLNSTMHHRRE